MAKHVKLVVHKCLDWRRATTGDGGRWTMAHDEPQAEPDASRRPSADPGALEHLQQLMRQCAGVLHALER